MNMKMRGIINEKLPCQHKNKDWQSCPGSQYENMVQKARNTQADGAGGQMSNICEHLYNSDYVSQTVELFKDGYAINGCCGGGCFVITNIKYCPFCGMIL